MKTKSLALFACMALLGVSEASATTYSFDITATGFTCELGPCATTAPYPTAVEDFSLTLDPTQTYSNASVNIISSTLPYPLEFDYTPGEGLTVATDPVAVGACSNPDNSACMGLSSLVSPSFIFVQYTDSVGDYWYTSQTSLTATPLPSTWTMLIAGFVGLGFFAYRGSKRSTVALVAA